MINEASLLWGVFIAVCAVALFGLRFFKPPEKPDEGFTDKIGEGESIHMGYTDNVRPDLINRPSSGMSFGYSREFWASKYTPIWLVRKRKEKAKDTDEDRRRE